MTSPFTVPTPAILYAPPRTECCLRLWALEHPGSPLSHVIPYLLSGGFSFRILTSTAPALIPLPVSPPLRRLDYQDVELHYRMNLTNILSRPNARRFLTYGGILWRLALHYSDSSTPQDLVVSALNGPTIAASLVDPGLYDDEVTDEEIAALLGTNTRGLTIWPPESVFCASDRWAGCWTTDNEAWFQKHLLKISVDIVGSFRTRREWLRNGFQTRRKATQTTVGSELYAKGVCLQHDDFSPFPCGRLTNL